MRIGFIGLGNMGQPMVRNLLRAGHEMTVFDRTRDRAEALRSEGVRVAQSPAEAARNAQVLMTMVANDAALEDVMFPTNDQDASEPAPALPELDRRAIHISMSTIGVALSRRLAEAHAKAAQGYLAAPVFGSPEAAAAGTLGIVVAGPTDQIECCSPIFDVLGQHTMTIGSDAPQANIVKLAGTFLSASTIAALGEAFALMRKSEIDPETFLQAMTQMVDTSSTYETYGAQIAKERFESHGFTLALAMEEMKQLLHTAAAVEIHMPLALAVYEQLFTGVTRGDGDLDWTGLARMSLEHAEPEEGDTEV